MFTNWYIRCAVAALPVFVLLVGISNVLHSNTRVLGVVALVVGGFLTVRAARTASVVIEDSGVVVHELLRTRHFTYADLQRASTNDELDHYTRDMNAALAPRADGAHLVLHCNNGAVVRARSVRNGNHGGRSTLVEDAVDAINAHIRQAAPGSAP